MLHEITLFQGITLAIAVLGAVLRVINTWIGLDKSRVKLLVTPKHAIPLGAVDQRLAFCVGVINLSAFPVTVDEVRVLYRGEPSKERNCTAYLLKSSLILRPRAPPQRTCRD